MSNLPYHTAYQKELSAKPCQSFRASKLIALVNDVFKGLPSEFGVCDVLYAEPPTQGGMKEFDRRSGHAHRRYRQFVLAIGAIIDASRLPCFMVIQPQWIKDLPKPRRIIPVRGQATNAVLLSWRTEIDMSALCSIGWWSVVCDLADRFDCVGDFVCGYGNTGRIFLESGKSAVLTDYNPKCIGYVKEHYPKWKTNEN